MTDPAMPTDAEIVKAAIRAFANRTNRLVAAGTIPKGAPLRWHDLAQDERRAQIEDMREVLCILLRGRGR